jgi:diacylglycerol kinase family enzyme
VLLVNRKAGAGRGSRILVEAERLLQSAGLSVTRASGPEQLAQLVTQFNQVGHLRAVVAVGGDGTVGLALNHTPPGVPLAVLPAGTENLLAKYLGQRARPAELVHLLTQGVMIQLDAGEANGRLFTLMISVGFDAEVVRRVHDRRRGNITHLAYLKPTYEAVRSYQYPPIRAAWQGPEGQAGEATGRWVFGMNLPRYAQGLPIAPQAIGTDGLLDLCVFQKGRIAGGLWYLWHLMRRRHHLLRSVSMLHCRRVLIESETEELVPYQLDGDPGGFLPVEVAAVPGRMTCIVSPEVAVKLGFQLPVND